MNTIEDFEIIELPPKIGIKKRVKKLWRRVNLDLVLVLVILALAVVGLTTIIEELIKWGRS